MAKVILKDLKKVYPNTEKKKKVKKGEEPQEKKSNLQITDEGVVAVQQFSLEIADKEFIVLVGPSGCGKSTTLRMIAGLEDISGGELTIGGKLMNDVEPKDRDIAMVFQSYALYPHMTVYGNMAFSLKLKKVPKDEIDRRVRQAAEILDITQYLDRKPKALSGGQRQRVAIGRAIVRDPAVFLMDEPLSNLDAKLRNQMRAELIKLRERIDTTFIYVTHDQTEAMTLGDRIVIMKDGFIQQIGTPQEVFDHPANLFVAGFIGTPQMNLFDAHLARKDGKYTVTVGSVTVELSEEKQQRLAAKEQRQKQPVGFQRAETLHHLADRIIGPMQRHRMDHRILCAGAQIKHRLVRGLRDPGQHFGPEIRVSAQQYRRRKPPVNRGQSFLDLVSGLFQQEEGGRLHPGRAGTVQGKGVAVSQSGCGHGSGK